jgi:hypothetical protein
VRRKAIPREAIVDLRRRLDALAPRSPERRVLVQDIAQLYGVAEVTLYRALRERLRPKALQRSDRGMPRKLPREEMESYCEVIAALKVRTSNKAGRHLSTGRAIELLEGYGVETPRGLVQPKAGMLTKTTVNRYLKQWGYDRTTLGRSPAAVRFQARHSNECWQFDLSHSDLAHVKKPLWFEEGKGRPILMLYSVVDDRSGVCYMEYHCVYGEDVEAALRFLFNAMVPKSVEGFPFEGRPSLIYMDNGPIAKSHVFQRVMAYLGIDVRTHIPAGKDGRRVTARAKGKVERPFRTVKEMHETLYHFHEPQNEVEANSWLMNYLVHYNDQPHRSEAHSRIEDWQQNLPENGMREMCSWDRFCTFAREPERRKVGIDATVSVDGVVYEVDPDLAGEAVVLWWGIFDNELYVELGERRFGPYRPVGAPIPLHHYRALKKTKTQQRADRIDALAATLELPRAVLDQHADLRALSQSDDRHLQSVISFADPDPFREFTYPSVVMAKSAIADHLGKPLAKLSREQMDYVDTILAETLNKHDVMEKIRAYFTAAPDGESHAH